MKALKYLVSVCLVALLLAQSVAVDDIYRFGLISKAAGEIAPVDILNFEDVPNDDGTIEKAENYYTFAQAVFEKETGFFTSLAGDGNMAVGTYGNGGICDVNIVDAFFDAPFNAGDHHLMVDCDFTQIGVDSEGIGIGFRGETQLFEGTPKGLSLWVYAPEGTPNFSLSIRVKDGKGDVHICDFTQNGIDWKGWRRLETSFANLEGPFSLIGGEALRILYLSGGDYTGYGTRTWISGSVEGGDDVWEELPREECRGTLYFDNLQLLYEDYVVDVLPPEITAVRIGEMDFIDGMTFDSEKLSFDVYCADVENPYTSGMDCNSFSIILNGKNPLNNTCCTVENIGNVFSVNNLIAANGENEITVSVEDRLDNKITKTIRFNVNSPSAISPYNYEIFDKGYCKFVPEESRSYAFVSYEANAETPDEMSAHSFSLCNSRKSVISDSLEIKGYINGKSVGYRYIVQELTAGSTYYFYLSGNCVRVAETEGLLSNYCYDYTVSEGGAIITGCDFELSGDVIISSTLDGYPVIGIGDNAFKSCVNIERIILPNSLVTIGEGAFYDCTCLKYITIPESVRSIGAEAFKYCESLENVILPEGLVTICSGAFADCTGLKNMTVPDSVKSIGGEVFDRCDGLESVTFGRGIGSFGEDDSPLSESLKTVKFLNEEAVFEEEFSLTRAAGVEVIYGYKNSTAQALAEKKGLVFTEICPSSDEYESHAYKSEFVAPTCITGGYTLHTCTLCGESYKENCLEPNGHAPSQWITLREATCIATGLRETKCIICENVYTDVLPLVPHTDSEWITDEEPTCTSIGYKHKECNFCGVIREEGTIPAKGHEYTAVIVPPNCTDKGYTLRTCVCGDFYKDSEVPALGHAGDSWTVEREADCLNSGLKYKQCTVCNVKYEWEDIPATGHNYVHTVVAPDCLTGGLTKYDCSGCGHHYEDAFTSATGHIEGKWIVVNESTCEDYGFKYLECSICNGFIRGEDIQPLGHSYNTTVISPTCTEGGETKFKCTACGKQYSDSYVNPLGHTESDWIIDCDSTCTEKGAKHKECMTCGFVLEIDEVALKAHREEKIFGSAPTCTEPGYTDSIRCEDCDKIIEEGETIPALNHKNTIQNAGMAASVGKDGYEGDIMCTDCWQVVKFGETIPKISSVKLTATKYTYDGKTKTPVVTVKDSKGRALKRNTDYTVKYSSGRKNTGKYAVTVSFKGNYDGVKNLSFTIVPKAAAEITATQTTSSITAKWSKVAGATGYKVYLYKGSKLVKSAAVKKLSHTFKKLTAGTEYTVKVETYKTVNKVNYRSTAKSLVTATKTVAPKISKITAGKGTATVYWNNISGESGYQVYYSANIDGDYKKSSNVKANATKSAVKSLKKGKTYYFKVRAYKNTKSGTVYSSWSAVKDVKIK